MLRKITRDRCYHFEKRENEKHDLVRREAPATLRASDLRHSRCPATAPSPVRRRTAGRKWGGGPRPSATGRGRNGWVRRCWDGWALSRGRAAARNRERGDHRSRASVGASGAAVAVAADAAVADPEDAAPERPARPSAARGARRVSAVSRKKINK